MFTKFYYHSSSGQELTIQWRVTAQVLILHISQISWKILFMSLLEIFNNCLIRLPLWSQEFFRSRGVLSAEADKTPSAPRSAQFFRRIIRKPNLILGNFRVVLSLCFKARLSAKPLRWKSFSFQWLCTFPRFETEA